MKILTSICVAANVSRVYLLGEFEKLYLCKIIACVIFSISLPNNHLHTNKQLINLLYYSVKNLNSILNRYIGPSCVVCINNTKAVYISV